MLKQALYYIKRPYHLVKTGWLNGFPARLKYRQPQRHLQVLTITGTDGKTTSSTLLYHVLKTAGYKVGLISTVGAYIGENAIDTGFHVTAPQPSDVYRFMRQMVDEGYTHLVLETTSHGIYQYRTWGITPKIAGVTNIANEHLDYHITYENYLEAKSLLLKKAQLAVINADDQSYPKLKKILRRSHTPTVEYSAHDRLPPSVAKAVNDRFPEVFNQTNSRLIFQMATQLGVKNKDIATGIMSFPGIPGRMQSVPNTAGLNIIVDFAHTPQALEQALLTLRATKKRGSNLIAVFGAAGLRDPGKRPAMTKVAVELADLVVLTAEDPRTEDVWSIIRQMKEQLTTGHRKLVSIADRQQAIQFALSELAKKGDTVGIFGKGHETSMCYGTVEYPWSDFTAIDTVLKTLPKKA